MTFVACGINHKTAPIEIREKITPSPEKQDDLLLDLVRQPTVQGAMLLTTCNRTEIYCDTEEASYLLPWLASHHSLTQQELANHLYLYPANEGIRHTMRVACGLDSMVLGEPQIFGQMKQAYHRACRAGTMNDPLHQAFRYIFNASKKVRSQTTIGNHPVSIAFTAVHLIRKMFDDLNSAHVLLIGSGDTASLVARYLKDQGTRHFYVASRNLENAQKLAEPFNGKSLTISDIPHYVNKADIVISATNCPLPFIGKEIILHAMKKRFEKPLFLLDLAVPRDMESDVGTLDNVHLYNIDDLESIANEGIDERRQAAFAAEKMIECELENYLRKQRGLQAKKAICHYRHHMKSLSCTELQRAQKLLSKGGQPQEVLEEMSRRLINKILHQPSLRLRKAGFEERTDLLEHIHYLYGSEKA